MPVGPYGAITGADTINNNQGAIQQAASQLRQKFSSQPGWTYGAEGISDDQRQAGMNANLLRSGGGGIGQMLGFQPTAQGARAGGIIGAGLSAAGVLPQMETDTAQYLKAPTYVAPPTPAPAATTPYKPQQAGPTTWENTNRYNPDGTLVEPAGTYMKPRRHRAGQQPEEP